MRLQVQHAVCEQRMLLHRRLALELYPHTTQLKLYPHTWHGESECKGVDDVGYQSKGVDDVGYGALTPWEHHGKQHHNTSPHHTTTTARRERVT